MWNEGMGFRNRRRVAGRLALLASATVVAAAVSATFLSEPHGGLAGAAPAARAPSAGTSNSAGVTASVDLRPSHHRLYRAEVEGTSAGIGLDRPSDWTVRVTAADGGPVAEGALRAALWHVDEDSPLRPVSVAALDGGGRFLLEGVHLDRPGWWNVKVDVTSSLGSDSLAFNVIVAADSDDDAPPEDPEFGFGPRTSGRGLYRVTLRPSEPLAKRKLQTVPVEVVDAEGWPVEGATVTVDGGMPEHGHGLPTRPRVTGRTAEGLYVIDGLRFSMDGWWVLELTIVGPSGTDSVTFNIEL